MILDGIRQGRREGVQENRIFKGKFKMYGPSIKKLKNVAIFKIDK